MQVTPYCRKLALVAVFREYGVESAGSLLYFDLQRSWDDTGLRRSDLDAAINDALGHGDLVELYTHEGRLAVLTGDGRAPTQESSTLRDMEQQHHAATVLQNARQRRRRIHGLVHQRLRAGDSGQVL